MNIMQGMTIWKSPILLKITRFCKHNLISRNSSYKWNQAHNLHLEATDPIRAIIYLSCNIIVILFFVIFHKWSAFYYPKITISWNMPCQKKTIQSTNTTPFDATSHSCTKVNVHAIQNYHQLTYNYYFMTYALQSPIYQPVYHLLSKLTCLKLYHPY